MQTLTRRDFVQSTGLSLLAAACCKPSEVATNQPGRSEAMLYSRPGTPTQQPEFGLQPLGLGSGRDGFIYIPPTYTSLHASPLLVLMHGAGQSAREFTRAPLGELFDKDAIVVVIPDSRNATWDMIYGEFGPDVQFIDRALGLAFTKCRINPDKIALGGFSDGATYALSLGITNANLFHTILAFSPGFVKPAVKTGKPRIFIGHGRQDDILPIDVTSREIVAALKEKNYPVKFEEFDGGHTMTRDEVKHAIAWFMATDSSSPATPGTADPTLRNRKQDL
jgi:phospholipase/carboxylesterase